MVLPKASNSIVIMRIGFRGFIGVKKFVMYKCYSCCLSFCKTRPIEIAESKHTNAVRLLLNTSLPFKFAKHRKAISTKNPMVANTNKMLFTSFLKKGFIINKVLRLKIEIEVS